MGRLVYSVICSVDGYLADETGDFSWAVPDEEVLESVTDDLQRYSTFLYGRRMYELMTFWESAEAEDSSANTAFAEGWRAADKVVYSTTLTGVTTPRTRLERRFDPDAVTRLKAEASGDLTVDGPTLAAHALRQGLVDELRTILVPTVLGGGLAVLPDGLRLDLRATSQRSFGNGMVELVYDVA